MKLSRNPLLPTLIHIVTHFLKFKISHCETPVPVPSEFGHFPEYGQLLSPGPYSSHHNSSNTLQQKLPPPSDSSSVNSLESLSSISEPQYEDGGKSYDNYASPENDYFHHYDYDEGESSEELKSNKIPSKSKQKNQDQSRGFEDGSSSSLMKFLWSPLKPFSLLPSVFRKLKKKKRGTGRRRHRGRNRRPLKGRRDNQNPESESSSELRGIRDDGDDEFDLYVDSSESSAGYQRKKKKRGRGRWWRSRGKGRGRKRRRKPKNRWRNKRPRPQYDDEDDTYDEGDDYRDRVPIKVTFDSDLRQNDMSENNGLSSFDNQHNNYDNNKKPSDLHKSPEEQEQSTGTLASFFRNNLKSGFGMMQGLRGGGSGSISGGQFNQENSLIPSSFWNFGSQRQNFPRSIYDKLPPIRGIRVIPPTTTTQRPYIAPPNHPMRIMRPPIPPRLPPFFTYPTPATSYEYVSAVSVDNGSNNNGRGVVHNDVGQVLKNDELGTQSASFNFPEFPPQRQQQPTSTAYFRPTFDETVPPPYLAAPPTYPSKITIIPPRPPGIVQYPNGFATRVRFPVEVRPNRQLQYLRRRPQRLFPIRLRRQRFNPRYAGAESNIHQISSFSTPPASFPNLHYQQLQTYGLTSPDQEVGQETNQKNEEEEQVDAEHEQLVTDSTEMVESNKVEGDEQLPVTRPEIIYGKWNPLLDTVDETSANMPEE